MPEFGAETETGAGLFVRLRATTPIPLDLDLTCAPGEILALVGPSGAGKSTVLRCVAGLHRLEAGEVRCGGASWLDTASGVDVPPHRRAAGLVFQDYALFPHMTALGNVVAAMSHHPRAGRETRARELLALVHLADLEARRPAELSGGQQQRVAVARALARDPAVLLLDEPFSAVDRATRRRLQEELAALRHVLSIPILLVTHDLDEAAALADRICVIEHGRGLQTAPAAELLARPATTGIARLLDLRNVFQGIVHHHDVSTGVTVFHWGGRSLSAPHDPTFSPGEPVGWLVRGSAVTLHHPGHPLPDNRENTIPGRVVELLSMGEEARIKLDIGDPGGGTLSIGLPLHIARRDGVVLGEDCVVFLHTDGIHLMHPESLP